MTAEPLPKFADLFGIAPDFDGSVTRARAVRTEPTPIHDALVLERLAAEVARPSLWRRAVDAVCSETFLWVLLLVIVAALGSLLISGAGR